MGLMQLHGVSPGGCATRFTPEACSPFRDCAVSLRGTFGIKTLPLHTPWAGTIESGGEEQCLGHLLTWTDWPSVWKGDPPSGSYSCPARRLLQLPGPAALTAARS